MVLIAIIRISQVHIKTYNIWATFWQQLEGCVAILMVSLTAFRTLFVSSSHRSRQREQRFSHSDQRSWYRYKNSRERDGRAMGRARIEIMLFSATLTGMRTFIRGSPRTSFVPAYVRHTNGLGSNAISVTHDLKWDSDSITPLQSPTQYGSLESQGALSDSKTYNGTV